MTFSRGLRLRRKRVGKDRRTPRKPRFSALAAQLVAIGGTLGSATERQTAAIAGLGMGSFPELSREQASALLSALSYAQGVLHAEIRQTDGYEGER